MKKSIRFIIVLLVILSGIFYYQFNEPKYPRTSVYVTKVVDGDTLELDSGMKVRMLGINTPDKGMLYCNEATQFSRQVENKTVMLESHGGDQYGRILAYVYLDDKMINNEIVRAGLAHLYYYEMDSHYNTLKESESYARLNGLGIWKPSLYKSCFSLIDFKHTEPERVVLQNSCNRSFNLVMKDDASAHIVKKTISANSIIQQNSSHVFNDAGDSLYVWDDSGLVIFERY